MARQLRLKLERREGFRREDLITSAANADAIAILDAWPAWIGGAMALVGPEGSGKSHLAQLWARRARAAVIRLNADPAALPSGPVLVEDVDRDSGDEVLFHLINRAAVSGGMLLTARTAPAEWPAALPDLRSRLNAMAVATLSAPDDAILRAALEKFFRERNIRPGEDVIPYLLNRIERSIPRALEIVIRLDEASDAEGKSVSRALARQILDEEPPTLNLFEG